MPVSFLFPPGPFAAVGQGHFPPGGFCAFTSEDIVEKYEKQALQVAKEVVIKFIEVGRISPNNFGANFSTIYADIVQTIAPDAAQDGGEE